jgi:hypothetical protein
MVVAARQFRGLHLTGDDLLSEDGDQSSSRHIRPGSDINLVPSYQSVRIVCLDWQVESPCLDTLCRNSDPQF